MRIGTPLSPTATRVMLLGAGELGKEVIIALQRLGVEVIAVDRYPNAPGHQVAHRAHVVDMTDPRALRELVERERPHLIVPEIEAIATDALAEIEAAGRRGLAIQADVSSEEQVQAMFRQMMDAFGTIDILVNNAGVNAGYDVLMESKAKDFEFNFGVNTIEPECDAPVATDPN